MNEKQLHALAAEFAKILKTPEDLNQFSRMLKKITVEAALNAELTDPLAMKSISPEKAKMHVMANSLKYVSWKDYKAVTADLKLVYQAPTEAQARENLTALSQKWQAKYPLVAKCWEDNWANIATFFDYPNDIRKAIYTTNAVESLNSVIRRVIKIRNVFPTDDSVFKVIWLAMKYASKKWTMPIQNWKQAMNRFMIDFGARLDEHR